MAGKIVITKSGITGITKNGDDPVNSKVKVYKSNLTGIDNDNKPYYDNRPMLCDPKTLQIIGHWD